jgi:hypothetical protein
MCFQVIKGPCFQLQRQTFAKTDSFQKIQSPKASKGNIQKDIYWIFNLVQWQCVKKEKFYNASVALHRGKLWPKPWGLIVDPWGCRLYLSSFPFFYVSAQVCPRQGVKKEVQIHTAWPNYTPRVKKIVPKDLNFPMDQSSRNESVFF